MSDASDLPTGVVTVLFTDIEASTRLLATLGVEYLTALNEHRAVIRDSLARAGGVEVDTQGDAFFVVFSSADAAVQAAVEMQHEFVRRQSPLTVRIGIHTGEPVRNGAGYVGLDIHRGARICAAGHGGQIVVSRSTRDQMIQAVDGVLLRSLGSHRLKDLDEPIALFDVVAEGLRHTFPPLRTIGAHPTNLPAELPELVGRDELLASATALLSDSGSDPGSDPGPRLVTLTGPGGTGKTAFASRLAATMLANLPDGAFVVWLASIDDAPLVPDAVATALGLRERTGSTPERVVIDYLAERETLLYFDNFEQVMGAAPFVQRLLDALPKLRVLVTSRIALRVAGEHELPIPPLPIAQFGQSDPLTSDVPPAVELFRQRARTARATVQLDGPVGATIAEICNRLDGLPLAIELAAARVRLISPETILERLALSLDIVAGGGHGRDQRHQTLRSTIEWSYQLLDERLKQAFVRLAIFQNPFTIEAAEQVCATTLDELAELLDHSLLRSFDAESGSPRLGMLVTIGAYARERLQALAEYAELRDRHAAWCADLARHGGPQLLSGDHERYLARFDAEQDELRAALRWLMDSGQDALALKFAADLAVFWDTRGQWTQARAQLTQVLAKATDDNEDRARALFSLARMATMQQDFDGAREPLAQAMTYFRASGNGRAITLCLSHLARTSSGAQAITLEREALQVARASEDPWSIAVALNNYADTVFDSDPDQAQVLLEEAAQLRRALGEKRALAITLGNVGALALQQRRYQDATAAVTEALSLSIDIGYEMMIAETRRLLGELALVRGDPADARPLFRDALERAERLGDRDMVGQCEQGLERAAAT